MCAGYGNGIMFFITLQGESIINFEISFEFSVDNGKNIGYNTSVTTKKERKHAPHLRRLSQQVNTAFHHLARGGFVCVRVLL